MTVDPQLDSDATVPVASLIALIERWSAEAREVDAAIVPEDLDGDEDTDDFRHRVEQEQAVATTRRLALELAHLISGKRQDRYLTVERVKSGRSLDVTLWHEESILWSGRMRFEAGHGDQRVPIAVNLIADMIEARS